ncbi:HD domain-containing protein [Neiella marina]|uniref:HD domain-containing protein n=1 Tax=Neiella holothuriorum TaxID=2870530 RepID=A0ABS7EBY8_9GAMM|nr:HD domain-containing phosphohydrolase [Neiella holothuriorum]MBW8189755.1 HD domain-containing protein [Neiella holothuriorum]
MRSCKFCFVAVLWCWFWWAPSSQANQDEQFEILVLHSYSTDFEWTQDIHHGIHDVLDTQSPSSHIRVEFMDTKNIYHADYLAYLAELYRYKYRDKPPDGVILSDNNAMAFFNRYGRDLFPNAKVVAGGINRAMPPPLHSPVNSVIAEVLEHERTFQHALALRPNASNIYVITDHSTTGLALQEELKDIAQNMAGSATFHYLHGLPMAELMAKVAEFDRRDIVYIGPYFRANNGETYQQSQVTKAVAATSPAALFASWNFQMVTGVMGGQLVSGANIGRQSAMSLLRLLRSEHVASFQANLALSEAVFDYDTLRRFGLSLHRLPPDAIVINQPQTFWQQHKQVIVPALVVITILSLLLLLVWMNLKKQRALNHTNQQMMALDREVIETQQELVATLGEVIEVRSHETRNHVIRVAKISRYLAGKLGYDEPTLDLLEAASPMHDVGKIGIPEEILHKPGKLTPAEYHLMQQHAQIGYQILSNSERPLLVMASKIAHQHHERWDGTGYPQQRSGDDIDPFARITALADIYDAVSSERCYKPAWSEQEVLGYIKENRGAIFEPKLVDVFLSNFDEIRALRNQYL